MKKKIKLFSDEDGTKFGQDVKTILANLKVHLQKWGGPAQQIIGAIKFVSEQIKEGTPGAQLEQFESDYVIQNVYTILKKAE
jgi:hypothetical protein